MPAVSFLVSRERGQLGRKGKLGGVRTSPICRRGKNITDKVKQRSILADSVVGGSLLELMLYAQGRF